VIHPIEHVNMHQSTNDVFPTTLKIAAIWSIRDLSSKVECVQGAFQKKEKEFSSLMKIGKTELQEAVPMTLGAEFGAFAEAFARDRWRVFKCEERLRQVNIGGTAVGTGLCAPRDYIFLVIEKLRAFSGLNLCRGENVVDQTANSDCFVEVSGVLKAHACNLIKIANDLRLLNFFREIRLPQVQAGSSIMPGKVNPVICESVMQAGLLAMSCDGMLNEAVSRSSLQINEFLPAVAYALFKMTESLMHADEMFARHVADIQADQSVLTERVENAQAIITAFIPKIGYQRAEELVKEFQRQNKLSLRSFLSEKIGEDVVCAVLSPEALTALGFVSKRGTVYAEDA